MGYFITGVDLYNFREKCSELKKVSILEAILDRALYEGENIIVDEADMIEKLNEISNFGDRYVFEKCKNIEKDAIQYIFSIRDSNGNTNMLAYYLACLASLLPKSKSEGVPSKIKFEFEQMHDMHIFNTCKKELLRYIDFRNKYLLKLETETVVSF